MEIHRHRQDVSAQHGLKNNPKGSLIISFILLSALALSTAGCVTMTDYEASQEQNSDTVATVDLRNSVGQTFTSRRSRLNGITIWLTPAGNENDPEMGEGQDTLTIRLYHKPGEPAPIFTTTILPPSTGSNLPVYIQLSGLKDQGGQSYYLQLTKKTGSVEIKGRNEDAYAHGQAFLNSLPVEADIAFRLSYDYGLAALVADARQAVPWLWLVLPLLVSVWLPGWLLLEFSHLRRRFDLGEQVGMSVGLSLAVIPLVMLWTSLAQIKWTRQGLLFGSGFLVAIFIIRLAYRAIARPPRDGNLDTARPNATGMPIQGPGKMPWGIPAALAVVFIGTLAVRFIMVRDMATPAWVDSVHHALITRLILADGGYPPSYLPFWDFSPSAYHPGYHSLLATFTWLSDLNLDKAMLILGQVLNALMVFPVYLMAKTLSNRTSAGVMAATISGFITPMPAYYTSWGRYTELAGLLVLPSAFVLAKLLITWQSKRQIYTILILGTIATAGLFMVHYRVILFLLCLILSFLLVQLPSKEQQSSLPFKHILLRLLCIAAAAFVLVLPWLIPMFQGALMPFFNASKSSQAAFFQDFSWTYLNAALGKYSLALAGLGFAWGAMQRRRLAFMLGLWMILLFVLANLGVLRLPGGSLINNTSVEIMLFIPISILGSFFLDQLLSSWKDIMPPWMHVASIVLISAAISLGAISGARQLVSILNPVTILSRQADLSGIEWVKNNIPEDETIVIDPFAWGYGVYAGNDGGYWISPLTGRQTLPPSVLYAIDSQRDKINELSQKVIDLRSDPVGLRELMISNQLDYVYIGARGGVLSPSKLSSSGVFTTLYQNDGVWIFAPKP